MYPKAPHPQNGRRWNPSSPPSRPLPKPQNEELGFTSSSPATQLCEPCSRSRRAHAPAVPTCCTTSRNSLATCRSPPAPSGRHMRLPAMTPTLSTVSGRPGQRVKRPRHDWTAMGRTLSPRKTPRKTNHPWPFLGKYTTRVSCLG